MNDTVIFLYKNTVILLHNLSYKTYEQGIQMEKEQGDMRHHIANLALIPFIL